MIIVGKSGMFIKSRRIFRLYSLKKVFEIAYIRVYLTEVDLCTPLPSGVPHTRETTLLGDSATTTRRAGLGRARKGFSEDQDERL